MAKLQELARALPGRSNWRATRIHLERVKWWVGPGGCWVQHQRVHVERRASECACIRAGPPWALSAMAFRCLIKFLLAALVPCSRYAPRIRHVVLDVILRPGPPSPSTSTPATSDAAVPAGISSVSSPAGTPRGVAAQAAAAASPFPAASTTPKRPTQPPMASAATPPRSFAVKQEEGEEVHEEREASGQAGAGHGPTPWFKLPPSALQHVRIFEGGISREAFDAEVGAVVSVTALPSHVPPCACSQVHRPCMLAGLAVIRLAPHPTNSGRNNSSYSYSRVAPTHHPSAGEPPARAGAAEGPGPGISPLQVDCAVPGLTAQRWHAGGAEMVEVVMVVELVEVAVVGCWCMLLWFLWFCWWKQEGWQA